jgi:hypothetical protein
MFHYTERPFVCISYFLGIQKTDFDEVAEELLYVGECVWELILYLLDVLENDFAEVDKAMFLGVDLPCQIILCFQGFEKIDLDEDAKVMFQLGEWTWELITFQLYVSKDVFGKVDAAMF